MTLNGIDVSRWQPSDICTRVPYDFAVVKASEGYSYTSPTLKAQAGDVLKRGKLLGLYHFADGLDPKREATHFVAVAKPYLGRALLVLDFEAQAVSKWGDAKAAVFCAEVTRLTGVTPLVYASASVARTLKRCAALGCGLWVASWGGNLPQGYSTPPPPAASPFPFVALHQYTSNGRLSGYSGRLDLNVFHGDAAAWHKYASPQGTAATKPATKKSTRKSVIQIAREVWQGKWGNGATRKAKLQASGYDPTAVQREVNKLAETKAKAYPATTLHTVQKGETLSEIARKYGTTWQYLQKLNKINNPNLIYPGQRLRIK